jgi:hypothetical protein
VKLGRAVGIVMQSILRHEMTKYETLLPHGVGSEEASAAEDTGDA